MTTLSLPANAGHVARSWLTVNHAANNNARTIEFPFRSINVEEFTDRGVRLTSTDGHVLASAWVPVDENSATPPEPDETPDDSLVVFDEDKQLAEFMKRVRSTGDTSTLTAEVMKAPPSSQLSLFGEMDEDRLVLVWDLNGDSRVSAALRDEPYLPWRRLLSRPTPANYVKAMSASTIATAAKILGTFGHDISAAQSSDDPLMMRFNYDGRLGDPSLLGAFSLGRPPTADEVTQDGEE